MADTLRGARALSRCVTAQWRRITTSELAWTPQDAGAQGKIGKKKPAQGGLHSFDWWRWAESNRRPKTLHSRDYMLSRIV